jgi:pheromone shutdown protein TraB
MINFFINKCVLTYRNFVNSLIPDSVTKLEGPKGSQVLLIGTYHSHRKHVEDVELTIRYTMPNRVVIQLSQTNKFILDKQIVTDMKNKDLESIVEKYDLTSGEATDIYWESKMVEKYGSQYGEQYRAANREAKLIKDCEVIYCDRPFHITTKRYLAGNSDDFNNWEKFRMHTFFLTLSIAKFICTQNQYLKLEQRFGDKLVRLFPNSFKFFYEERARIIGYRIWKAAEKELSAKRPDSGSKAPVVVGVIERQFIPNIVENWKTFESEDISSLLY